MPKAGAGQRVEKSSWRPAGDEAWFWQRQRSHGSFSRCTPFPRSNPYQLGIHPDIQPGRTLLEPLKPFQTFQNLFELIKTNLYGRKGRQGGQTYCSVWREINQTLRVVDLVKPQVRGYFSKKLEFGVLSGEVKRLLEHLSN